MSYDDSLSVSINKYISSSGFCSRRDADLYIEQARVTINNEIAQKGNRVKEGDVVKLDGERIRKKKKTLYIALNKPVGVVCTTDPKEKQNIVRYVNHQDRLFPIGRLDKDSEGLIFLTNDGDIVNKILRSGNNHDKEYVVTVNKKVNGEFIKTMASGVNILGKYTKKCKVKATGDYSFKITLTEGMNRQIRRMCRVLGYDVTKLKRVRIMNVTLDGLRKGQWRLLSVAEMNEINELIKNSSKTAKKVKNAPPPKKKSIDKKPGGRQGKSKVKKVKKTYKEYKRGR